jgi:DNA-binding transcriptional regulator YiaG
MSCGAGKRKNFIEQITPLEIKKIMYRLNLTYRDFARELGYSQATVYGWYVGTGVISEKAQNKILEFAKERGAA